MSWCRTINTVSIVIILLLWESIVGAGETLYDIQLSDGEVIEGVHLYQKYVDRELYVFYSYPDGSKDRVHESAVKEITPTKKFENKWKEMISIRDTALEILGKVKKPWSEEEKEKWKEELKQNGWNEKVKGIRMDFCGKVTRDRQEQTAWSRKKIRLTLDSKGPNNADSEARSIVVCLRYNDRNVEKIIPLKVGDEICVQATIDGCSNWLKEFYFEDAIIQQVTPDRHK